MNAQQLQETEADCLRRFRAKADKLRAADPRLSKEIAFARAVELMPKTANRYQSTRSLLQLRGVPSLP